MKKKSKNESSYYSKAMIFAMEFASNTFKTFTVEDVKNKFHESNEEPIEPRVWGMIFYRLQKENKIIFKDYQKSKSKKCHGRKVSLWISIEYSNQQKFNRTNGKNQVTMEFDG